MIKELLTGALIASSFMESHSLKTYTIERTVEGFESKTCQRWGLGSLEFSFGGKFPGINKIHLDRLIDFYPALINYPTQRIAEILYVPAPICTDYVQCFENYDNITHFVYSNDHTWTSEKLYIWYIQTKILERYTKFAADLLDYISQEYRYSSSDHFSDIFQSMKVTANCTSTLSIEYIEENYPFPK